MLPSSLHPGHQFYHSLLCVVLQFLILRLMGRTVTAVFTTLCFQMVNCSQAARVTSDSRCGEGRAGEAAPELRGQSLPSLLPADCGQPRAKAQADWSSDSLLASWLCQQGSLVLTSQSAQLPMSYNQFRVRYSIQAGKRPSML